MGYEGASVTGGRAGNGRASLDGTDGFTIIEVLVAIILLVVGILGALIMINTANGTTLANQARTGGVNLAREVAEGSRAVGDTLTYSKLSTGCAAPSSPANPCSSSSLVVTALKAQPGLASIGGPGTWTVRREGIDYSINVSVCSMDDPGDGAGSHSSGGPFCADVGTGGSADNDPDDYKRVVVDVRWSGTRGTEDARAVALVRSDGANGPAVTCLAPTGQNCPLSSPPSITSSSTTSISLTAKISGDATRLVWYVDGAFQGTVTPSGGTAQFTWQLGTVGSASQVVDGTYAVSATAIDENGDSGSQGSVQVQVNRRAPVAPSGFLAGRDTVILGNGSIGGVDVEWLPVPDKDVLYYRVYRKTGSTSVLVHQTSGPGVVSYTDRTVPANPTTWSAPCSNPRQAAASQLYYYVVAVDQSGTSPREGTQTSQIDVNACNTPPHDPPTDALSIVQNPDGTLTLTGQLPAAPGDADANDKVNAIRLYRWEGGNTPRASGDRIQYQPVGSATSFTYTDPSPRPDGVDQSYCFTTVDLRLQESNCSNVVVG